MDTPGGLCTRPLTVTPATASDHFALAGEVRSRRDRHPTPVPCAGHRRVPGYRRRDHTRLAATHDLLLGGRDAAALGPSPRRCPPPAHGRSSSPTRPRWPTPSRRRPPGPAGALRRCGPLGTVADSPAEQWRQTFEVNVVAVAELTRRLLPALRVARGHAVCINSGAGLTTRPGWGSYAASKFALRAFADALRAEEAAHGIRVMSVYPGRTDTDMQRAVVTHEGGEYDAGRFLRPQSVARAVLLTVTAPPDADVTELSIRPAPR